MVQRIALLLAEKSPVLMGWEKGLIHVDLISLTTHSSPIMTFRFMENKEFKHLP